MRRFPFPKYLQGIQEFKVNNVGHFFFFRSRVELILPPNAHELAHSRLHVSITNTKTRENCLVSNFPSREDLIKVTQPHLTFEEFSKDLMTSRRP